MTMLPAILQLDTTLHDTLRKLHGKNFQPRNAPQYARFAPAHLGAAHEVHDPTVQGCLGDRRRDRTFI